LKIALLIDFKLTLNFEPKPFFVKNNFQASSSVPSYLSCFHLNILSISAALSVTGRLLRVFIDFHFKSKDWVKLILVERDRTKNVKWLSAFNY